MVAVRGGRSVYGETALGKIEKGDWTSCACVSNSGSTEVFDFEQKLLGAGKEGGFVPKTVVE